MAGRNTLGDSGNTLNPQEGTVYEYLAKPTPPALNRRISATLICLAIGLYAFAAVSIYATESQTFQLLSFVWEYAPIEILLGSLLMIAGIATLVYSVIRGFPKQDSAIAVKKAVLRVLIDCPRSGISLSTRMESVRLRSFHLPFNRGVVRCWHPYMNFMEQDFASAKPAEFGGVDMLIQDGKLYVFLNQQSKAKWLEKR